MSLHHVMQPSRQAIQSVRCSTLRGVHSRRTAHTSGACTPHAAAATQVYCDTVVSSGSLTINRCGVDLKDVFCMLSRTTPCSPGLQTLSIDPIIGDTATAALLSAAVLQHTPSLSALHLPALACDFDTEAVPTTVLAAVARCAHLTSLHIAFHDPLPRHSHAAVRTVAALAATIAALPHLADFRLHHISAAPRAVHARRQGPAADAAPACKRQRLAERLCSPPPPLSLDPVITALAAAPALTYLALSTNRPLRHGHDITIPCSGVTGAFTTLRHLDVGARGCQNFWLPALHSTPLPVSPLPALTALRFRVVSCDVSPIDMQKAICAAAQQPRLRLMEIAAREAPAAALCALSRFCAPAADAELQALTLELGRVAGAPSMRTVAAEVAHVTTLCSLVLRVDCIRDAGWGGEHNEADDHVYGEMLQPLSALQRLDSLSLEFMAPTLSPFIANSLAAAPLHAFPCLTRLKFDFDGEGLHTGVLAPRLTGLSQLLDFQAVLCTRDLRTCLAALTALTSLNLLVPVLDADLVRSFGDGAAAMPRLQVARLQGRCGAAESEEEDLEGSEAEGADGELGPWVSGLSHLPSWGHYWFDILWRGTMVSEPGTQEVIAALEARGAVVTHLPADGVSVRF